MVPGELPEDSVIHLEHEHGYERVVLSHATTHSGRVGFFCLLAGLIAVAGYFWIDALLSLFGGRAGFDEVATLLFTSLLLAFFTTMARTAFRRRVPESVVVLSDGLIHDSDVDPYRRSPLERKNTARQSEQFLRRRKRQHFSAQEVATLTTSDIPYANRICLETDNGRHDIGEALRPDERAWLYGYITGKLASGERTVSQAARVLIDEVQAEEIARPLIEVTDVHSPLRVDPLDFDEPIARKAAWHSLSRSTANFRTHHLVREGRRAAFKATLAARGFAMVFPMTGLLALVIAYREFVANNMQVNFESAFVALFALVFLAGGLYLVSITYRPIVFDLAQGCFSSGWRAASTVRLDQIRGIQLLSFASAGGSVTTGYELNLLLADGSREHVLSHGDADRQRHDAAALARFLGTRLYDGIRGLPVSARKPRPYRDYDESPLTRLVALAPTAIIATLIVWILTTDNSRDKHKPASPTRSDSETAPVQGRPATFEEVLLQAGRNARSNAPASAHFMYQELLRQAAEEKVSDAQRIQLFLAAGSFYLRYQGIDDEEVKGLFRAAIDIIDGMPAAAYHYERAYGGLERYYVMRQDYAMAAEQVAALLDYYRRTYGHKPSVLYAFETPTSMRLAQHLVAAGRAEEAREIYFRVLEQERGRGQRVWAIQKLIDDSYNPSQAAIESDNRPRQPLAPPRPDMQIVFPGAPPPLEEAVSEIVVETPPGDVVALIQTISIEGLYLDDMQVDDTRIELSGYADSNTQIAAFMRSLDHQVGQPDLKQIATASRDGKRVSEFLIDIKR